MPVIETERLRLENWRTEDLAAFRPIATYPEVMRYIGVGQPWTDERIAQFIAGQIAHAERLGYCLWKLIDKSDGGLIGHCGLQPLYETGETEIGWWLARDRWGRGLATEAARAALRYGFERGGLPRIVAIAWPENSASINIMRKLGMAFVKQITLAELGGAGDVELVYYAIESPRVELESEEALSSKPGVVD